MSKFARTAALLIAFTVATASSSAFATEVNNSWNPVSVKVTAIGTYSTGVHFIMFDGQLTSCSTDATWKNRFDIAANSPSLKTIIALATLAMSLDKPLSVHAGGCDNTNNKVLWDVTPGNGLNSYMNLSP